MLEKRSKLHSVFGLETERWLVFGLGFGPVFVYSHSQQACLFSCQMGNSL